MLKKTQHRELSVMGTLKLINGGGGGGGGCAFFKKAMIIKFRGSYTHNALILVNKYNSYFLSRLVLTSN